MSNFQLETVTVADLYVGDTLRYNPLFGGGAGTYCSYWLVTEVISNDEFKANYFFVDPFNNQESRGRYWTLGPSDLDNGRILQREIRWKEMPYDPNQQPDQEDDL